jgi:uncharacterized protein (TIGR02284 family)
MPPEAVTIREAIAALREACLNCETLIEAAAGVVEDSQFRRRLHERQGAWTQMSRMCTTLLRESGASPVEESIAPTLQRAWVKIKASINDEKGIVRECLRREELVREKLESTLRRDLPDSTRSTLRAVLDRVGSLELPP